MRSASIPHPVCCRIAILLGLGGMAASLASLFATPAPGLESLSCGIEALSCDTALTSRFASIAGIPLGALGFGYFLFWTLNLRAFVRTGDGIYRWVFSYVTLIGAIVSVTLGILMFFVLKAPCLYCLLSHLANLIALALLWSSLDWKLDFRLRADHFWHFATLACLALLAASTLYFFQRTRALEAEIEQSRNTLW